MECFQRSMVPRSTSSAMRNGRGQVFGLAHQANASEPYRALLCRVSLLGCLRFSLAHPEVVASEASRRVRREEQRLCVVRKVRLQVVRRAVECRCSAFTARTLARNPGFLPSSTVSATAPPDIPDDDGPGTDG